MGLTIYSKHLSHDLGAGGFVRLRKTIASLCPKEINHHHQYLMDHYHDIIENDDKAKEYDAKTEQLYEQFKTTHGKVIEFLWASDISARFSYGAAQQLLDTIGTYDDTKIYGYAGWGDAAMKFKDFKAILNDAATSKSPWGWR